MPRTAIYARKSSESDDRQALSLDAQLHWAMETCAKTGIREPLIFKEAKSAKKPGREEFGRMLAAVAKGEVDTIVCWKADRLARNAADAGTVLFALESKRLKRIITSDGVYADDADSELMLGILLGFSAKYSKDLSKNIRRGMEEKLRRGEWAWTAPFGYKNVRLSADRAVIEVDEEMAPYVRQLFKLAATGAYSIDALARITRDEWKVRKPQRRVNSTKLGLSHTTVVHILTNPFYRGLLVVKGEVYPGTHEPLVSEELYERVQQALGKRRKTTDRPKRHVFTLGGLVRCRGCGRTLTGTITKSKSGKPYTYYVCSNKMRRRCTQPRLSEVALLREVAVMLHRLAITEEEYAMAFRVLQDAEQRGKTQLAQQKARAETELKQLDAQQSRLLDLLLAGTITQEDYDFKRRDLAGRRAEAMLTAAHAEGDLAERFQNARKFLESLVDADSLFETLPVPEKRLFLRALGFQIEAAGEERRLDVVKPAAMVANRDQSQEWWSLWTDVAKFFIGGVNLGDSSAPRPEAAA